MSSMNWNRLGLGLVLVAGPSHAQTVVRSFVGLAQHDNLGFSIANCGDLDGDSVNDIALGAPGAGGFGALYVYSSATGAQLFSVVPSSPTIGVYGCAVAAAGDVDGDGVGDVLVGAIGDFFNAAAPTRVEVRSGAGGALLRVLLGSSGSFFGKSIVNLGDWNGDGRAEFAVAAPDMDIGGTDSGSVYVYDGDPAIAVPLFRVDGPTTGSYLGWAIALVGDINRDGAPDFAAGMPRHPYGATYPLGRVNFYSGESGEVLRWIDGPLNGTFGTGFGGALANVGDIDGDGLSDLLVGAPYFGVVPTPSSNEGLSRIYSIADDSVLFEVIGEEPEVRLGETVGALGDLDGDGVSEFNVSGVQGQDALIYSGRTRQLLFTIAGNFLSDVGFASCAMGDIDGDGLGDFAISDPGYQQGRGRVRIFATGAGNVTSYCSTGTTSNGCEPKLIAIGNPSASSATSFEIAISGLEGQKPGLLFYGVSGPKLAPWGSTSSSMCVRAPLQRTVFTFPSGTTDSCDGVYRLDWNAYIAAHANALGMPFATGDQVWAQGWFRDPPSSKKTSLTNALTFVFAP
ncbi:MAG: FG-GAP repeat protein [Planctomycetes bacterium]|nr:FG-GAP repeat protein [Planctomycetota bacterium]